MLWAGNSELCARREYRSSLKANIVLPSYSVYMIINAVLLAIQYFKFPETKDGTIEEIGTIFDGPQAATVMYARGDSMERDVRSVREEPEDKSM